MPDLPPLPDFLPKDQGRALGDLGLAELLPDSIGKDEAVAALSMALEAQIMRFVEMLPATLLWPAISGLEEPLLTHLAVMQHVDIWDETWSLAAKRAFLFRQILLHRKKGTAFAVEEAISLVYGPAHVRQWFEYGGARGCFRLFIEVQAGGLSARDLSVIELMVEKYKRKSQHLCGGGIEFSVSSPGTVYMGAAILVEEEITLRSYVPPDPAPLFSALYPATVPDLVEDITLTWEAQ